jgi:predicted CXXCH cytochrome family protein
MQFRFKVWVLGLTFVAACVLTPTIASAADDVTGTSHDFTGQGAASECVTCHVPHGSTAGALLWNHTLSSNTLTFGAGASTVAGTSLPTDIGSSPGTSSFCLSCHDGSVAVGDMTVGTDWGASVITGSAVIGTNGNIAGNHPVEIPYPDQAGATYDSITTGADPAGYQPSPTGVKIFGTTAGAKGMGCASCHNPHDGTNNPFLRVAAGSLCSSCHIK